MADTSEIERNRAEQTRLYGEPLQSLLGRYCTVLELTQSRLAGLLSISAPMLSQLINGHRVKLANPNSGQRLQALHEAVADVQQGRLDPAAAVEALTGEPRSDIFTARTRVEPRAVVRQLQDLFRQTASADEFAAAAAMVAGSHPEIAELLTAYGVARTDAAVAHFRRATGSADRLRA
jgi:transcriptional regulator with XRE-family HTH domain